MSAAMRSIAVWRAYVSVLGVALLLAPNAVLRLLGIAEPEAVWIRVVGVVVIGLAVYYSSILRRQREAFLPATVYARWLTGGALVVLAFTTGPWQLVLFGALDLAGALWTFLALRRSPARVSQ